MKFVQNVEYIVRVCLNNQVAQHTYKGAAKTNKFERNCKLLHETVGGNEKKIENCKIHICLLPSRRRNIITIRLNDVKPFKII